VEKFMDKNEPIVPSNPNSDSTVTHLGVTYTITHHAHQSETPLETCTHCGGSGQLFTRKCKHCDGRGIVVEPR
jgi:DnaJ-class molecular chaperone